MNDQMNCHLLAVIVKKFGRLLTCTVVLFLVLEFSCR